jgi:hypothetical protein
MADAPVCNSVETALPTDETTSNVTPGTADVTPDLCPDPGDETIGPAPTPLRSPSIPVAHDLASAIAAVNAIRMALTYGSTRAARRQTTPGRRGTSFSMKTLPNNEPDWSEVGRVTEKVRVENPDDPSQFVMIERINQLKFRNKKSKENWQWDRKKSTR